MTTTAIGVTAIPLEGTPMVVRPIAAGPHLIVNYRPGQPHAGQGNRLA
jgi:hypothetical protein